MKITPDNFAAVFEYIVGEPGPANFHDSLIAQHACRCDNCGAWWCDGEVLDNHDFSDEQLCIECLEGFANVWCDGVSASQHEAACKGLEMAREAVEFRTLDEALADQQAAAALAEFQTILNIIANRMNDPGRTISQHLRNAHRLQPEQAFTLAHRLDGFAGLNPAFRHDAADAKHCLDAIVMLRAA